jgi:hypothetical protein
MPLDALTRRNPRRVARFSGTEWPLWMKAADGRHFRHTDCMNAREALVRLGGIASVDQLLKLTSRKRLRTAVRRGEILRITRNRYALPTTETALTAARQSKGYLTHLSAAAFWGWELVLPPERPQIALPRGRRAPAQTDASIEFFLLRRTAKVNGWATAPLETVLACARDLPFRAALAVADSALRSGLVRADELVEATSGPLGPGARQIRDVARLADCRAANPFESSLRAIAIEAGLDVIPQYAIEVDGVLRHPDLADPLRGIVLEADSWGFHADKQAHDRDCARYNALVAAGWMVLRFTWPQVVFSPAYVERTIRTLLSTMDRVS